MTFVKVGDLKELWMGEKRGIVLNGKKILLIRIEDQIFAYETETCI